jgi:hypothetical protein
MNRPLLTLLAVAALTLGAATAALAWNVNGHVYCEGTGLPLSGVQFVVTSTDAAAPYSCIAYSGDDGGYLIPLPNVPGTYDLTAVIDVNESILTPASGHFLFSTSDAVWDATTDFIIASPLCAQEACWLTGGGARFSAITGTDLGQIGKRHNWGGNVYPGCSPTAGDGGQWNDIDEVQRLHFQGQHIEVIRCGNVDGIPAGSTSPVTPYNFIEFQGTGRLQGVKGNKVDFGTVYFFGRCEDRNEPGSNGQRDGAGKDRYFLNVYTNALDPAGSSVLLVDQDGDPATVDPLIITDGNLQIHVSSCDTPPASTALARTATAPVVDDAAAAVVPPALEFSAVTPNPAARQASLSFALPREANTSVRVFDVAGRMVRTLVDGILPAGQHEVAWDLADRTGSRVGVGVYFVRIASEGAVVSRAVAVTH